MPRSWSATILARTAGLLGVAAFAGSAASHALASRLLIPDEALAAIAEPEADLHPKSPSELDPKAEARERQLEAALVVQAEVEVRERGERIVTNNIFCPACQVFDAEAAAEAAAAQVSVVGPTELPLALLATMESVEPSDSMATIRDTDHHTTGLFGVGDEVQPGVVIVGIEQALVVLRSPHGMETLGFTEPGAKPEPKPARKPEKPGKPNPYALAGAREAIACAGNSCTVEREFVEKLIANPRLLTRQAKLLPAVKDGQTWGFRVYRVRAGTLPRLLGLHNGDTLLAVNGNELDSMDAAIGLYAKLRRASELNLTVERKGKVFEKHISIR